MKPSENPLGSEPVSSFLRRFAIPSVIAMLVSALYNMVDQLFIGHSIGVLGNAATNVAFPTQHGLHIHRSALRHRRCCKLQSLHGQKGSGAREILCWKCHLHAGNPQCDPLRCRSAFSASDDASLWCDAGCH